MTAEVETGRRAVIIGGTGLVGRAVARRLLGEGWSVDLIGRDPVHVPADLAPTARFLVADRDDPQALAAAYGDGADLLVDCVCFTRVHAEQLVPLAARARSTVMISSKAVYVDDRGRHSNSSERPDYGGPVTESQPTLEPGDEDYRSREGYGRNKVAAERTLLDSGLPVTILRPSKIHGEGARPPREWVFVKRVLDRRRVVLLAGGGRGVDHPSAAANIAALVRIAADQPATRVLNSVDPDAPGGREIARVVARHLGHDWREVLLDEAAPAGLGWHPWDRWPPVVLDMSAAAALGYRPVGDYAATSAEVIDWLAAIATPGPDGVRLEPDWTAGAYDHRFDYAAEDAYLASLPG